MATCKERKYAFRNLEKTKQKDKSIGWKPCKALYCNTVLVCRNKQD